ncbi:alpha/beta fold hydrolase [Saccharothrix obliqua]|uniref:alpha/beta fold hydrolase n=1 Tax=Saccharothrix obliqua TaxID=2861747 RepID=UPI001C5E4BC4|nr:alpha/beta fold hydrolase [Saccharothrix obliqua]MBW4717859.1 esterase FrsA [Saccharothrix obliqua]
MDELKRFARAHAEAQRIPSAAYQPLLDSITSDTDGHPGSWAVRWSAAADAAAEAGDLLQASGLFTMARFPFVDGPARQRAQQRTVEVFDAWRRTVPLVERLDLHLSRGSLGAWASGLSAADRRPLVVLLGGIVSVKEQWAPILVELDRLGFAGVVTELPGVGENTLPYDETAPALFTSLLDQLADRVDVTETYLVALSFGGHLALSAASSEPRLRGIVTVGAPVRHFFTDADWHAELPAITRTTLAHLTGRPWSDLGGWALDDDELAAVRVPVAYVASTRDEVIPGADPRLVARQVRRSRLLWHDDVHGSPGHATETRLWSLLSVLRMRRAFTVDRLRLARALAASRVKRVFSRT